MIFWPPNSLRYLWLCEIRHFENYSTHFVLSEADWNLNCWTEDGPYKITLTTLFIHDCDKETMHNHHVNTSGACLYYCFVDVDGLGLETSATNFHHCLKLYIHQMLRFVTFTFLFPNTFICFGKQTRSSAWVFSSSYRLCLAWEIDHNKEEILWNFSSMTVL